MKAEKAHNTFQHKVNKRFRHFKNDSLYYTICLALIVANICLFCYGVWFQIHAPVVGVSRYILPIGRGFGVTLELNCAIILIPMCHAWMTFLRRWSFFALIIPFNYLHSFHIFCARLITIGSVVHGGLQLAHFISASAISPSALWGPTIRGGISLFITGVLLSIILFVIVFFTLKKVRLRLPFETFFYSHHLFIFFYALLLLHGQRGGRLEFWKFFLLPGALYVSDRIFRLARGVLLQRSCSPVSLKYYEYSGVVRLEIPRVIKFSQGQYAELRIPIISSYQVHPFTIASSPEEETMVFYIKKFGRWTSALADIAVEEQNLENIRIFVSGPFGAPAQFCFHFDHVLLIGAGIGATPHLSAMKHAAMLARTQEEISREHKISLGWAKEHLQADGTIVSDYSISRMGLWRKTAARIFEKIHSLGFGILVVWMVLLCILIEAINIIFFSGDLHALNYIVIGFISVLIISLIIEYCLEVIVHGIFHYFQSLRAFLSIFDTPICVALCVMVIVFLGVADTYGGGFDYLVIILLAVLCIVLFVRLTLRVGGKNLLHLPHSRQVENVRSIDFVCVNRMNNDLEWMVADLEDLDSHSSTVSFNHHIYTTREDPNIEISDPCIELRKGRPDWSEVFARTTEKVLGFGNKDGNTVGVFFCGPPVLGEALRKECLNEYIKTKANKNPVYYVYHQEIF